MRKRFEKKYEEFVNSLEKRIIDRLILSDLASCKIRDEKGIDSVEYKEYRIYGQAIRDVFIEEILLKSTEEDKLIFEEYVKSSWTNPLFSANKPENLHRISLELASMIRVNTQDGLSKTVVFPLDTPSINWKK